MTSSFVYMGSNTRKILLKHKEKLHGFLNHEFNIVVWGTVSGLEALDVRRWRFMSNKNLLPQN
jgi:hypothetical protein